MNMIYIPPPRPSLFIRLVGIEGFNPNISVPVPPTFHLAFDVDGVLPHYNACSGGGKSMLRVSYHGMILAWANVPRFCVNGNLINKKADDMVTIEAKAEGAMLREDIRNLVCSEQQAIGKTEFDLEGDVAGLGSLSCKIIYSNSQSTDSRTLCVIQ
ncbi:hypothetical protein QOZ80_1AG0027040 [Eleusine coracana subsp. coracana]|nr:hypothetical protein QOZ80_1AG0027040 [Eleusine coracana subsp. coracana]